MVSRIGIVLLAILMVCISVTVLTGCDDSSEGDPVIHDITFDPPYPVPPNTDIHVTAIVEGEDLEYYWSVTGGLVREVDTHSTQAGTQSPQIAVTLPGYDDAGEVLDGLGFDYDTYDAGNLGTVVSLGYDAIFINSSDEISVAGSDLVLKTWVENGGALYASGTGADFIREFWPTKVTFPEPDPYVGSANTSGDFIVGELWDNSAIENLGFTDFIIDYPGYNWPPILDTAGSATTIAVADASEVIDIGAIPSLPPGIDFVEMPTSVSFNAGNGFVLYTNHHLTSNMDQDERELMDYLVTQVLAFPLVSLTHELISFAGYYAYADYSGLIDEDQTDVYTLELTDITDVYFVLNATSGTYRLAVTGPGGIDTDATGGVPISMAFPNVNDGTWELTITATDTDGVNNIPYVLSIGEKSVNEQLVTLVPEVYWRTPIETGIYGITLKVLDPEFRGDQLTVGIKVE